MDIHKKCPFEKDIEVFFTLRANDIMAVKFIDHLDTCPPCTLHIQKKWTDHLPEWLQNNPIMVETPKETPELKTKREDAFRNLMLETISRDIQCDLDFLPPSTVEDSLGKLGGLELIRVIGSGGMGVVFEALDSTTGEKFAVKTLKMRSGRQSTLKKRFFREAEIIKGLNHDGIVPFIRVGEDNGVPFFVMPLLKGTNLDNYLSINNQVSFEKALYIIKSIAETLEFAHSNGILHRDIKPANIWIESTQGGPDKIRILDFGLALADNNLATLTITGQLLGTPAYMPPEQSDNKKEFTKASDLFSLGCVFYLLVTGKKVFPGTNLMEILKSQAFFRIVPPSAFRSDTPPRLEKLILWLLQKSPDKRPQDVREFLTKLDNPKLLKFPFVTRRAMILSGIGATIGGASIAIYDNLRPKSLPVIIADKIYDTPNAIFIGECSRANSELNLLFWVTKEGYIHYLDDSNPKQQAPNSLGFHPIRVSRSPDSNKLLVCGKSGEICIFDFILNKIEILENSNLDFSGFCSCAWVPNEKDISEQFVITTGKKIRVFNIPNRINDKTTFNTDKKQKFLLYNDIKPDVLSNITHIQIHPIFPDRLLIAMEYGDIAYANLNQQSMIFQSSFEIGPFSMTKRNDIVLQKSLTTGPYAITIRSDGINACVFNNSGYLELWQPEQFIINFAKINIGIKNLPIKPIDIQYSKNNQSIIMLYESENINKITIIDELKKQIFAKIEINDPIFICQTNKLLLIVDNNGKTHVFDKYKNDERNKMLLR